MLNNSYSPSDSKNPANFVISIFRIVDEWLSASVMLIFNASWNTREAPGLWQEASKMAILEKDKWDDSIVHDPWNWTDPLQNNQTSDTEFQFLKKERKKGTISKNSQRFWQSKIIYKECDFIL